MLSFQKLVVRGGPGIFQEESCGAGLCVPSFVAQRLLCVQFQRMIQRRVVVNVHKMGIGLMWAIGECHAPTTTCVFIETIFPKHFCTIPAGSGCALLLLRH